MLIRRDGELVQYVPFGERAWHAGASQYRGRSECNDFSIGIELEGTDEVPYTDAQYEALVSLAAALIGAYAPWPPSTSSATAMSRRGARPTRGTRSTGGVCARHSPRACPRALGAYLPRSWRQRTSVPCSWRASTRAITNNRSDRRLR